MDISIHQSPPKNFTNNIHPLILIMQKQVAVYTLNAELFQCIMSIVMKSDKGTYCIPFSELCRILSIDVEKANKALELKYASYVNDPVFSLLMLPTFDKSKQYVYISSGEKYNCTDVDRYCILPDNMLALPYDLLGFIQTPELKTDFNESFAVAVKSTIEDCFVYAHKFDTTH